MTSQECPHVDERNSNHPPDLRRALPQGLARRLGRGAVLRRLAGSVSGRAVRSVVHFQAGPDRRRACRSHRQRRSVSRSLGLGAAVLIGVPLGIVMGWRQRVGYALDPLMTVFYASPLVALSPLLVIFFGVGVAGKAIIVFVLSVFPFIFNAYAGVHAVDRLLINVVRSLGGGEWDLYRKVIFPSVLPYIVAGARIAVGRALIGVLVGEFFAASEGIGYAISRFGDIFSIDRMFACILVVMVIAVVLTEGIRWAERAAFPWRVGQ